MTDAELVAAIRKILRTRPRLKTGSDQLSAEARDLARFDQIAGLMQRNPEKRAARAPKNAATDSQ